MNDSASKTIIVRPWRVNPHLQNQKPFQQRFWEKVDKNGPIPKHVPEIGNCWVWMACKDRNGYARIRFNGKKELASRISYFLKTGSLPRFNALHRCDNPSCVRPSHIWDGTAKENIQDAVKKKRMHQGVNHWRAKLNDEKVREIRTLIATGDFTLTEIAKRYSICVDTIWRIKEGLRWQHLD